MLSDACPVSSGSNRVCYFDGPLDVDPDLGNYVPYRVYGYSMLRPVCDDTIIFNIECSGNDRYEEYILVFPKKFQSESLYETMSLQVKGNKYTDKLRVMLYAHGDFETVVEPGKREIEQGSMPELFGKSI